VISPILRGMLGLMIHAQECNVTLAPHVPAGWSHFAVTNIHAGPATVDVRYTRSAEGVTLEVLRKGGAECSLDFSPALSLRAQVTGVEMNGRRLPSRINKNTVDQHVNVHVPLASSGNSTVKIRVKNDFGLDIESQMPSLGTASQGLRAIAESWGTSGKTMTAEFEGVPGRDYDVVVWNPQQVTAVDGGVLSRKEQPVGNLRITIPTSTEPFAHLTVTFHFAGK
jgi:hypothetical protein